MDVKIPYVVMKPIEHCQSTISIVDTDGKLKVVQSTAVDIDGLEFVHKEEYTILDMSQQGDDYEIAKAAVYDLQTTVMKMLGIEGDIDDYWKTIYNNDGSTHYSLIT